MADHNTGDAATRYSRMYDPANGKHHLWRVRYPGCLGAPGTDRRSSAGVTAAPQRGRPQLGIWLRSTQRALEAFGSLSALEGRLEHVGTSLGLTVRRRRDADMDCLVHILRACYEVDSYPAFWPDDPSKWLRPSRQMWALVGANAHGRLVGHVAVHDALGHPVLPLWVAGGADAKHAAIISRLIVSPDHRRMGYATNLVDHAVRSLIVAGITPVLDVAIANSAARALYASLGWAEVGSTTVTRDRTIPVVAMIYRSKQDR